VARSGASKLASANPKLHGTNSKGEIGFANDERGGFLLGYSSGRWRSCSSSFWFRIRVIFREMSLPQTPRTIDLTGQLVFLGTGTSVGVPVIGCDCETCRSKYPRNYRTRCGLALGLPGGTLLVDTPTDLRTQLLREGIGLAHAAVFTHSHADHIFGLDDLRLFPYYLGRKLPLYCEPAVEDRIRKSFDYAFPSEVEDFQKLDIPRLEIRRITTEPFEVLGAKVTPIRLLHGSLPVLGFRFGNVAYCTDTNQIPDESWALLKGLDTVILDALRPKQHRTHFNLDEAIAAAQRIGARRTLFTHMAHELEHEATNAILPPGMELAYDGMRVALV
jgi:phosphoribosyl 1,2-cyclic phosphate phosphodiesterase